MIDFSRYDAAAGAQMIQSVSTKTKSEHSSRLSRRGRSPGIELALPLSLLTFVVVSEYSPLLKIHQNRIVEWLCDHDNVANTFGYVLALLPVWMLSSMLYERLKRKES